MILRLVAHGRLTALILIGLVYSLAPAAGGGCGYGCYALAPVLVRPYYYPSCSCCGCGTSPYVTTYPYWAYVYRSPYYGYPAVVGEYDDYDVAPRFHRPRLVHPRHPRRGLVVRH